MYLDNAIPYPAKDPKFTLKVLSSGVYVYYEVGRDYKHEKQHTVPRRVTVAKIDPEHSELMHPNEKYIELFGLDNATQDEFTAVHSTTLSVGTYIAIKKIIADYKLDELLSNVIKSEGNTGIFIDLAAYEIIASSNVVQHYAAYAYRHPAFTQKMRIYSDAAIGDAFEEISSDEYQSFLNVWNQNKDKSKLIYVSYDSTNRHARTGNITKAEYGKPEDGYADVPVINQAQAYDTENRVPLFYESYPESVNDVSLLQYLIEKCIAYGYMRLCFILDRVSFGRDNLFYLDSKGFYFLFITKGNAKFIRSLVKEAMGTFEGKRKFQVKKFMIQGTTIIRKIFPDDPRDKLRYIHVYYDETKAVIERKNIEQSVLKWGKELRKCIGKPIQKNITGFCAFFDLKYDSEGNLLSFESKDDLIEGEKVWAGYFAIVSSMEMTAETALLCYKGRDCSKMTFLGDKFFLGNDCYRAESDADDDTKEWIAFVGEIIRNKIYTDLLDAQDLVGTGSHFMSVSAAIAELEKYEISRQGNGKYHIDHPLTKQQRMIMEALHLKKEEVEEEARRLCNQINELIAEAEPKK